jgi:outer membrane protein with beta-barrel domain
VVRTASVVLIVWLATAGQAAADWFVAPFIGVKFAGDTSLFDDQGANNNKITYGSAAGYIGSGILGVEVDFGYSPRFFERSSGAVVARSHVLTLMGNLLVTVPQGWAGYALRPYVSGGAGYMQIGIDYVGDVFEPTDSDRFAINVGGGAVGGLTARTSVRFDVRYFKSVYSGEQETASFGPTSLHFWRASVGLSIR